MQKNNDLQAAEAPGRTIDLRSDTVTQPTKEMREAMYTAVVGDDVFGEDPTVAKLEGLAASMLGKEKGMFVPSGTMGNIIATLVHTKPSDEMLIERRAHHYYFELGGMAALAGVIPNPLSSDHGILRPEHIQAELRISTGHDIDTTLLWLENTHNLCGGTVASKQDMDAASLFAKDHGMKVHVDGARLFNAAVALGVGADALVEHADSVMICLAKGLGAPVGSILAGSEEFIHKAHKWRTILGGGMRQAGIIAAAGVVALETGVDRLAIDNENAKYMGEEVNKISGISVDLPWVHTNFVYAKVDPELIDAQVLVQELHKRGVLCFASDFDTLRLATHRDLSRDDIDEALGILKEICEKQ